MTIAGVTIHEFVKKKGIEKTELWYESVRDELFPTLKEVINIKTIPISLISVSVYPSLSDATGNLEGRKKMMEYLNPFVKDGFSMKVK